ncbi:MAG: hypothetical protein Q7J04_04345 [Microcella sp.]|nr:hypothetical protein [Microcella sp.]
MRLLPPPAPSEPPSGPPTPQIVEQHVNEGVLVARSALRLAVKNGVILATLRDARPWNLDEVTALGRESVDALPAELTVTAERLEIDAAAQNIHGRGARRRNAQLEASRLELRALTARGVVEHLRRLHDDPAAIDRLVQTARDDTLTELMQARLQPERETVTQTPQERRIAMEGVVADLLELQDQRYALRRLGETDW